MKEHWLLERDIVYLNHGSFGATPIAVLAKQDEFRTALEREPVRFLVTELEPLLDDARRAVAEFVGADTEGLAFVPNATAAVNAVLRSLDLDKHDELLITAQEYNACRNIVEYVAQLEGAKVVVAETPFPVTSADDIVASVLARVTDRTRLLLIDHIVSQTAVIQPVATIVRELNARGIDTLVDGAHAPGMIPLNVREIGAAYYTGNLHKWVCAPKGAAFLHVRENRRASIRPIAISHGANSMRTDRSRFHLEFDWTGTYDPSAWLAVPEALRFMATLVDGGWPEIRRRNHELVLRGRDILAAALDVQPPVPDEMLGSMAVLPLPDGDGEALHDALLAQFRIEVPMMPWPQHPKRLVRISAQLYNEEREYHLLAEALVKLVRA